MTSMPDWRRAARLFREAKPHAQLGLHFDLTEGRPLTAMPRFAPSEAFPGLGATMAKSVARLLPRDEIAAEFAAQWRAFEDAMGRPPDFVDGHQHVHAFPGVRDAVFDELGKRRLPQGFWLRDSADALSRVLRRKVEAHKAAIVAAMSAGFGSRARGLGFATNEGFAGFSAFDANRDYAADFATYLTAPGSRHLVMCHPGVWASHPNRRKELEFLLSPAFPTILDRIGARLSGWI